MSETSTTTRHLHPTADWPNVACDNCGTVYEITQADGLITGHCPHCGNGTFNTTMTTGTATKEPAA